MLGTRLDMFTADFPQTDGQTEQMNFVIGDTLRSVCVDMLKSWSIILPVV